MPVSSQEIVVRTFSGCCEDLATLLRTAWEEEYGDRLLVDYSPEFVRWVIEAPGNDPELMLGAYAGRDLVGFAGRFPRRLLVRGQPLHACLGAFLTAHPSRRRQGVATLLNLEALRRMKAKGYEALLFYVHEGHFSVPYYKRFSQQVIPPTLATFQTLIPCFGFRVKFFDLEKSRRIRVLDGLEEAFLAERMGIPDAPVVSGRIREYGERDLVACRSLLEDTAGQQALAEVWEDADLAWRLASPCTGTLVYETEAGVRGFVNYRCNRVARRHDMMIAFIVRVAMDTLEADEQLALVLAVCRTLRGRGCSVVAITDWNGCPSQALRRAGFVADTSSHRDLLALHAFVLSQGRDLPPLYRGSFEFM